ncbi:MAG: DUF177 domain-containing protein [Magnetospirillum sp.]|nr:MAG: DUF177 domain-containing protein [Magnetospirillum sp.]
MWTVRRRRRCWTGAWISPRWRVENMDVEFSRPVRVERLGAAGSDFEIEANEAERRALAERFGLVELSSLSARLRLTLLSGGLVRLSGRLSAEVVQSCVVTLQPVAASLDAAVELTYGPDDADGDGEIELTFEGDDPPDAIVDGTIDMGEAVAEQLALELNPFPRAPGAVFEAPAEAPDTAAERRNPFAALAGLREKKR